MAGLSARRRAGRPWQGRWTPCSAAGRYRRTGAASFDRAGVARLIGHRDRVPGGTERSILVGVSLYAASGKLLFGTTDVVVADQ